MAMKIDTWAKWYALAAFSFCNTTINEFIGSALIPWFTNTIQDQKTRYLDHNKSTCMAISLVFDVYSHVMSVFGIYLMFSQARPTPSSAPPTHPAGVLNPMVSRWTCS